MFVGLVLNHGLFLGSDYRMLPLLRSFTGKVVQAQVAGPDACQETTVIVNITIILILMFMIMMMMVVIRNKLSWFFVKGLHRS